MIEVNVIDLYVVTADVTDETISHEDFDVINFADFPAHTPYFVSFLDLPYFGNVLSQPFLPSFSFRLWMSLLPCVALFLKPLRISRTPFFRFLGVVAAVFFTFFLTTRLAIYLQSIKLSPVLREFGKRLYFFTPRTVFRFVGNDSRNRLAVLITLFLTCDEIVYLCR